MKDLLGTEIVYGDIVAVPSKKKMFLARVEKVCNKQIKVTILDGSSRGIPFSNYYHADNTLRVTDDPKVSFYLLKS